METRLASLLDPRRLVPAAIAVAAIGGAVAIGYVGASAQRSFDWRLFAETGTAFGTILLATYTATLARTTRAEVGLAIEEQRARDRPVIIVTPLGFSTVPLNPRIPLSVPALQVRIENVGLAPALDLRLHVAHGPQMLPAEIVPVVPANGGGTVYDLSLSAILESPRSTDELVVDGDFEDRTRLTRYPIVVLEQQGLANEQRAALELGANHASLWVTAGHYQLATDEEVRYRPQVGNNGDGTATEVTLQFFDHSERPVGPLLVIGTVLGGAQNEEEEVAFTLPHPDLDCRITWRDGTSDLMRSALRRDILPAQPAGR